MVCLTTRVKKGKKKKKPTSTAGRKREKRGETKRCKRKPAKKAPLRPERGARKSNALKKQEGIEGYPPDCSKDKNLKKEVTKLGKTQG